MVSGQGIGLPPVNSLGGRVGACLKLPHQPFPRKLKALKYLLALPSPRLQAAAKSSREFAPFNLRLGLQSSCRIPPPPGSKQKGQKTRKERGPGDSQGNTGRVLCSLEATALSDLMSSLSGVSLRTPGGGNCPQSGVERAGTQLRPRSNWKECGGHSPRADHGVPPKQEHGAPTQPVSPRKPLATA